MLKYQAWVLEQQKQNMKNKDEETTEPEDDETTSAEQENLSWPLGDQREVELGFEEHWNLDGTHKFLKGILINAESDSTVRAALSGEVVTVADDPQYGLTVKIESENWTTIYSNLAVDSVLVTEGKNVSKGDSLAKVSEGTSLIDLTHPFLLFKVYKDGEAQDPKSLLP